MDMGVEVGGGRGDCGGCLSESANDNRLTKCALMALPAAAAAAAAMQKDFFSQNIHGWALQLRHKFKLTCIGYVGTKDPVGKRGSIGFMSIQDCIEWLD